MLIRLLSIYALLQLADTRQINLDLIGRGSSDVHSIEESRSTLEHFFQLSSKLLQNNNKGQSANVENETDKTSAILDSETKIVPLKPEPSIQYNTNENESNTKDTNPNPREGRKLTHSSTGFDDEAYVEVYNEESNNGMNYRDDTPAINRADTPAIDRQDSIDPPFHIPGLTLPISHRKETLQEIYLREKMPEIQKIIASGNQQEIARLIAESEDDPFTVLPNNLKYSQLLAADLFFSFLTKMVTWFVMISLLLPALVPAFTLLSLAAELLALWLIPDLS